MCKNWIFHTLTMNRREASSSYSPYILNSAIVIKIQHLWSCLLNSTTLSLMKTTDNLWKNWHSWFYIFLMHTFCVYSGIISKSNHITIHQITFQSCSWTARVSPNKFTIMCRFTHKKLIKQQMMVYRKTDRHGR